MTDDMKLESIIFGLKAEIERLEEYNQALSTEVICQIDEKATLREQVKELPTKVLEEFICSLVNRRLVSTKDDLYYELLEAKDDLLKEKYGML